MKITICGSLQFIEEMNNTAADLKKEGHTPLLPDSAATGKDKQYWKNIHDQDQKRFPTIRGERIKLHCRKIDEADAILVLNHDKNGKRNYIGPNTFLEMGYAFARNKKIFLFNDIPDAENREELEAMQPIVIKNNLKNIGV